MRPSKGAKKMQTTTPLTLLAYRIKIWFSRDHQAKGYAPNYSHVWQAESADQAKDIAMHEWGLDTRREEEKSEYGVSVKLHP